MFGHRIDNDLLNSLERQEIEIINTLWLLWYFFATQPRTSLSNALRQIPTRAENIVHNIFQRILAASEAVQGAGLRSVVLKENKKWVDFSSIYILLDVEKTTLIYPKVEEIIQSLREKVGIVESVSLENKLINEYFHFIVIVVTVQGKMINTLVWPLHTVFTITTHTPIIEKLWAFIPQELPQRMMEELGLTLLKNEEIDNANQISAAVSSLRLLLSLISKIKGMPELTKAGLDRLNVFMEFRSRDLSNLLQIFVDSSSKLLEKFNNLSTNEQGERPYLRDAVTVLEKIYKKVLPGEDFKGQEFLDLDGVINYMNRLQSVISECETIKLLWIEDIIENTYKE